MSCFAPVPLYPAFFPRAVWTKTPASENFSPERVLFLCCFLFLNRLKIFFAKAAPGADPVIRDVFKGSTGSNAAVGISNLGIVLIATDTDILQNEHFLTEQIFDIHSIPEMPRKCKLRIEKTWLSVEETVRHFPQRTVDIEAEGGYPVDI